MYILKLQDSNKEKILNAVEEPEKDYRLNNQELASGVIFLLAALESKSQLFKFQNFDRIF